ncbi:hypothetical protein H9Q70_014621, partial [Fusarium xylarioides]
MNQSPARTTLLFISAPSDLEDLSSFLISTPTAHFVSPLSSKLRASPDLSAPQLLTLSVVINDISTFCLCAPVFVVFFRPFSPVALSLRRVDFAHPMPNCVACLEAAVLWFPGRTTYTKDKQAIVHPPVVSCATILGRNSSKCALCQVNQHSCEPLPSTYVACLRRLIDLQKEKTWGYDETSRLEYEEDE